MEAQRMAAPLRAAAAAQEPAELRAAAAVQEPAELRAAELERQARPPAQMKRFEAQELAPMPQATEEPLTNQEPV